MLRRFLTRILQKPGIKSLFDVVFPQYVSGKRWEELIPGDGGILFHSVAL
jgi:hypothetical protein